MSRNNAMLYHTLSMPQEMIHNDIISLAQFHAAAQAAVRQLKETRAALRSLLDGIHAGTLILSNANHDGYVRSLIDAGEVALDPAYTGCTAYPSVQEQSRSALAVIEEEQRHIRWEIEQVRALIAAQAEKQQIMNKHKPEPYHDHQ